MQDFGKVISGTKYYMVGHKNIVVKVESLTSSLSGVGHIGNKAVFIEGVLPGEEVVLRDVSHKKNYCMAIADEILSPSPFRRSPPCPLYNACGGCNFMHCSYPGQLSLKEKILRGLFQRVFKTDLLDTIDFSVVQTKELGYRNRARFHLMELNRETYVPGFQMRNSNEIIPVQNCPCLDSSINNILKNNKLSERINESLKTATKKEIYGYKKDGIHVFGVSGANINGNSAQNTWLESEAQKKVCLLLCKKILRFDVRGFFQSNIYGLERLIDDNFFFRGDSFLDFYSGCGTFSVFLEDSFKTGVLLEHNVKALSMAKENLSNKNIEFIGFSDSKWCELPQSQRKFDLVVMDPPRSGLSEKVINWLIETKQPEICFISCNPVTLVRDFSVLIKTGGYRLKKGRLYDFYPQTGHMESFWILKHEN